MDTQEMYEVLKSMQLYLLPASQSMLEPVHFRTLGHKDQRGWASFTGPVGLALATLNKEGYSLRQYIGIHLFQSDL